MKWIGQNIYDLISRFRDDVYLEDISTGTIASGGNLGLDSNNKIVKAIGASGDLTSIVAGTGLSGTSLTGPIPTLNVDAAQTQITSIGTIATGVWQGTAINQTYLVGQSGTNTGDQTSVSGNAGTATVLATARAINGVNFDGSAAITVRAAAGTLSGDELNSDVVTSSLTSVGTIGTGVWQGTAIAQAYIAGDAINGDKIADDAVDSEHYTDGSIDTAHIAADAVTFAKAIGITPNIYGSIIKVLPSDFMANEEPGVTKTLQFVDNSSSGIKPGDNDTELLAFVSIPETMKATHVDVYADANLVFSVYEFNIHASVGDISAASKGTGNCNTTLDITDVNATATNYLLIQVVTVAKADRVWGAKVTIATQ